MVSETLGDKPADPGCNSVTLIYRLCNAGRPEQALVFLARYHGSGEVTPVAQLEYDQIVQSALAARSRGSKRWDFINVARTRANRYRLMLGECSLIASRTQ
jgi:hypothetical protein